MHAYGYKSDHKKVSSQVKWPKLINKMIV